MQTHSHSHHHLNKPSIPNPSPLAWLTLFGMLLSTALVWQLVNKSVEIAAATSFQNFADRAQEAVQLRMHTYEQVLRGCNALFNAHGQVSRKTWQEYASSLKIEQNFPGIQALGYATVIAPHALQQHLRQVRSEGYPDYQVTPPGTRDEYTSIVYIEPFNSRNQRAFGFDMFSEATRHAAMVQARDSGLPVISGKVVLKQETGENVQSGFLMYLPQYAKGALLDTPAQRRQALRGYIYSPFRMNDLMQGILGKDAHASDIDLEIFDGGTVSFHNMMYDSDGAISGVTPYQLRKFSNVQTIDMLGHPWTLSVTSTREFEQGIDHAKPMIVALAGIIISFLVFTVTWSLSIHRWRAQELAKRMTTALQEQEALTRAIVKDAADGILTIDSSGNILSFNRTAEQIFGYSADEVLGNNINMLMPEPFHSEHNDYLQNYITSGQKKIIGVGREVSGKRKDGEIFTMDLAVSEVNLSQARRIFSGIVRDISKRKQVEEALRQSEERFDLAIRGANDGLWDWDLKHQTVYFSPRWKVMLGYTDEEILDTPEEWRKRIHPDDLNHVMEDIKRCLDGHTTHYQNEHRMLHKDGHYLWVLDRGIAQRNEQGNPYRMVGILSDISQQKKMDQLKSEFVSTVSHELRTPLTSIRGSLGLIAGGITGPLPDKAKELIDIAYKNTERLLALINDILDIEKIQSGNMSFTLTPQPLMPLIEQVIAANRGYAEQYHVTFHLNADAPHVMVNVDSGRLAQVMSNLLSNAAKFSHAGDTVDINVSPDNNRVRVTVTDHGTGIPESFHEHIFEKFTQADSSDTRHKGGTGLGLNISKAIIELMQGEIGFSSKPGKGTSFYFILPTCQTLQGVTDHET